MTKSFTKGALPRSVYENNLYTEEKGNYDSKSGRITATGAPKAIDFLTQQIGKSVVVKPVETGTDPTVAGYFKSEGPGGSGDPTQRTFYYRPGVDYHTFFHEIGHARDAELPSYHRKEKSFNSEVINSINNPADRLKYYYETLIEPRVKAETEAQAYSGFQLPRFARENPGLNVNYKEEFNRPWFKNYPASYATGGIDTFYKVETGVNDQRVTPDLRKDSKIAEVEYKPNVGYNALKLELNQDLKKEEKSILNRTQEFIDERLNPYQTQPSPREPGYFNAF